MLTHFTCPHCGERASTERTDLERIEVNGQAFWFLALEPGRERHIDERLCCQACYDRADARPRNIDGVKVGAHPYGTRYHTEVRLGHKE
jgi:hypothetical protein